MRSAPRWLRVLLLLGVLLGGLAQAASAPVGSSLETAVALAQRGELATVQLQEGDRPSGFWIRVGDVSPQRRLLFTDDRGVARAAPLGQEPQPDPFDEPEPQPDPLATVLAAAPPEAAPDVVPDGGLLRQRVGSLGGGLLLLLLVLLATGPQPVRLTKWAWAWVLLALPLGLGAVLLLAREVPWSRSAERPAGQARLTGGKALLLAVAVAVLLSVVGALVRSAPLLDPGLVPQPYDVVLEDGARLPAG